MRPRRADTSEPACVKRKMLSTKRMTSWPSSSRKYSATVRAERATRARAPGGSFIWPKTSAVLEMTGAPVSSLDSLISRKRSLPSRVRSPTPAKHRDAAVLLGDVVDELEDETVLPTPAPPKSPILPPLRYGARRSMTLMPVSKISTLVDWSVKEGGSRWIGSFLAFTGPASSTGLPTTLRMRPRHSLPTGIMIGLPVSFGFHAADQAVGGVHRDRADVDSPRCCATSRTRLPCSSPRCSGSTP
jgi:hypothetical protein